MISSINSSDKMKRKRRVNQGQTTQKYMNYKNNSFDMFTTLITNKKYYPSILFIQENPKLLTTCDL